MQTRGLEFHLSFLLLALVMSFFGVSGLLLVLLLLLLLLLLLVLVLGYSPGAGTGHQLEPGQVDRTEVYTCIRTHPLSRPPSASLLTSPHTRPPPSPPPHTHR